MKRNLVRAFLAVIILVGVPLAFIRGGDKISLESVLDLTSGGIDRLPELLQRIRNFHRIVTRDGRRLLEVSAKEASFFKDDRAVVVKEPRIIFYDGGQKFAVVRSDEARIFFTSADVDEVRLQGGVEFELDRFQLTADYVVFSTLNATIDASGKVNLKSPELSLRGDRLRIDIATRRLIADHNVRLHVVQTAAAPATKTYSNADAVPDTAPATGGTGAAPPSMAPSKDTVSPAG